MDNLGSPPRPERRLVARMNQLFAAAALIRDEDGRYYFTTGIRSKPSKPEVLENFRGLRSNFSSWSNCSFKKEGNPQLLCTELLLRIFSGTAIKGDISQSGTLDAANFIHDEWLSGSILPNSAALRVKVIDGLTKYERILQDHDRQRRTGKIYAEDQSTDSSPADDGQVGQAGGRLDLNLAAVPSLRAPAFDPTHVLRNTALGEVVEAIGKSFILCLEGVHGSGKTDLVSALSEGAYQESFQHLLYWPLTSGSSLQDLFSYLTECVPGALPKTHSMLRSLPDLLEATKSLLVIDNFERGDHQSYAPLIETVIGRAGPARLLLVSSGQIRGDHIDLTTVRIEGFTDAEARAYLTRNNVAVDENSFASLAEATDLLPYLLLAAASSEAPIEFKSDQFFRADDTEKWLARILAGLSGPERQVLDHLALCDDAFDHELIGWLADNIGGISAADLTPRLTQPLLLRRDGRTKWRLQRPLDKMLRSAVRSGKRTEIYTVLGDYYYEPWVNAEFPWNDSSHDVLLRLSTACAYFQRGRGRASEVRRLLQFLPARLRERGLHRILIALLEAERDNTDRDKWSDIKLSNLYLAIGEVGPAFAAWSPLMPIALVSQSSPDLRLALCRTAADILSYIGRYNKAEQVLTAILAIVPTERIPITLLNHAQSILVWAYLQQGRIDEAMALNDRLLENTPEGEDIGIAVALTRRGVGHLKRNEIQEAIANLQAAQSGFRTADLRGFAWSSLYLAFAYSLTDRYADMESSLFEALTTISNHNFVGDEYYWLLTNLKAATLSPAVSGLLVVVLNRQLLFEEKRTLQERELEQIDALIAGLQGVSESALIEIGQISTRASSRDLRSTLYKSYVRRSVSSDPVGMIDRLFSKYVSHKIFSTLLLSNLLTEAAKKLPAIASTRILPHFQMIERQRDEIKFHYARYFLEVGDFERTLNLTYLITNRENFEYHRILGHCLFNDLKAAEREFDQALTFAYHSHQRATGLSAKAVAIYRHGARDRYDEAIAFCREALSVRRDLRFHEPRNVLVALEIEACPVDQITPTVARLRAELNLSVRATRRTLQFIRNATRRGIALESLSTASG